MQNLVLVPGLNCTGEVYAPALSTLAQRANLFVANVLNAESIAEMAADVLASAPHRFSLAGHSMGGYVAFEILRQAPERVEKLALIATLPGPDKPEQTQNRRRAMDLVKKGRFMAVARANVDVAMHRSNAVKPEHIALRLRMAEQVGPDTYLRQQEAIITRPDSRPLLGEIKGPTIVIAGEDDQIMPLAEVSEMASAIPDAQLIVVPQAGHFVPIEQPDAVNRALLDWLDR